MRLRTLSTASKTRAKAARARHVLLLIMVPYVFLLYDRNKQAGWRTNKDGQARARARGF